MQHFCSLFRVAAECFITVQNRQTVRFSGRYAFGVAERMRLYRWD